MAQPTDKRLVTEAALNADQDVQDGRIALLEGAAGFDAPPLGFQDEVVAALMQDGTLTGAAYGAAFGPSNGARPVGKGELFYNAKDWGAVGDGTADDTLPLNTAAAAVFAINPEAVLLIPAGNYRTTGTVSIKCGLEAYSATLRYEGVGTALVIGDDTGPAITTARRSFRLPRVINTSRGTNGWDGTSKGVLTVNLNTCDLYVPFVQDFEEGLIMRGHGGGNAYNNIFLGALWENRRNLVIDVTEGGYSNQHQFYGGRLQHSTTKGATLGDMGAHQIKMYTNNTSFFGTSLEGHSVGYYRVDLSGRYNNFYNCRWEAPGDTPRVIYRTGSERNTIDGGYNADSIVEIFEGGSSGGIIRDYRAAHATSDRADTQAIPSTISTEWVPITSWRTPTLHRCTYNPATGEFTPRAGRWQIIASVTFQPTGTGRRQARLIRAGSLFDLAEAPATSGLRESLKLHSIVDFDGQQSLKVEVNQNSGGDVGLETTNMYTNIKMEYLGY